MNLNTSNAVARSGLHPLTASELASVGGGIIDPTQFFQGIQSWWVNRNRDNNPPPEDFSPSDRPSRKGNGCNLVDWY
jgi:hypothetical protein